MTTQIKLRRDTGANWDTNSTVVLAEGEIGVNLTNGQFKLGDGTSTWAALTYFQPGAGSGGSSDRITANGIDIYVNGNGTLVLPATDTELVNTAIISSTADIQLNSNGSSWTFDGNGALTFPSSAIQQDSGSLTCQTGVDTVVFTSSAQGIQTIKLLLQVEGVVTTGDADTQSCEMIVAKGFRGPTVVATVYAVVHTSVAPLATFTAQWNALISRIEVTCRPTSLTNSVTIKSFATEITTSD